MPAPILVDPERVKIAQARLLAEDPMFALGEAEVRGNRYRVFKNAPASLVGLFMFGLQHGAKDFVLYEDERKSYLEVWSEACRLANGLKSEYGVNKGDRVAVAMRNFPEFCVIYIALAQLGAVAVPLNAWWKTEEFRFALNDCGAKLVLVDDKRLRYIAPLKKDFELSFVLVRAKSRDADCAYDDLLERNADATPVATDIDPDDDFAIFYTSGSTGNPKGVILTHRGAVTTLMSWAFLAASIKEARDGVSIFGDDPGVILGVPLFHVTGSHSLFMMSWLIGRRIVMMPRWNAREAVELINRHQLTNFVGVPSQSFELISAAADTPMPSLIDIGSGGAKRPAEHVRLLKQRFPNANPSSGYGLSETNALGCVNSLQDYVARPDSTGKPVPPVCDIKIMTDVGEARRGEAGEVWIRTAANFRGYLNLPEETAKAITPDGWFRSGDVGRMDEEGFVYIVDRLKDMIIRGGENVSCLEVENRVYEHPAVAEACVFSAPDERLGEVVGLVVHAKDGASIDPQLLHDFIGEGLAAFKAPERIWISPMRLPRLGTEKFDKQTIRMVALQHPPAWRRQGGASYG